MRPTRFLLLVALLGTLFALPAFAQHLRQTPFEDGTGGIGLPAGWRILDVYRGQVQAAHGQDRMVRLGQSPIIERPGNMVAEMAARQGAPMARVGDLPGAISAIIRSVHGKMISLRARPAPPSFPGVPAYYILYRFTQGGTDNTGLCYCTTIDPGGDSPYWNMYISAVIARTPVFIKSLPTLMAIWKSWRPNGQAPKAGSESAVIDEVIKHSQESFTKLNDKFDKYIRE